jgi:acyl transferase domain-containing protein/3-hydroxymyristoyl/3-hydroxydecanoyl-(acyl carrier protein) dehydratase
MTFHPPHIAVVSMAGIFPGANDTRQFIDNILKKKQAVVQVPADRWAAPVEKMAVSAACPDRAVSDRAGLITDFTFDPQGFDLDPAILNALDPTHHLVLDAGRTACTACHLPEEIRQRTGVILAAIALPTDRASAFSRELLCANTPKPVTPVDALSCAMVSGPAAVLARVMGFGAGTFTLDAACASSLVAIKLACEHLITGRADVMVTGGVSRPDALYTQIGFSQLAALSPSGRCAPFDRQADGLVVGEGCGILVLKRLADALACQDPIFGIIRGWGISNDIQGNLVAPASEGQVRAMAAACDMAGLTPNRLQYMECHGSGTPVGDRVELTSIRDLLKQYDMLNTPLAIGSVKSNIGHLLTAAGAAGFIKTLLAMNQKTLPPSCNFTALPDNHPLGGTRVQVQAVAGDWIPSIPGEPRRAGVSAFGFGGVNAHILVEEFLPSQHRDTVPRAPAPPVSGFRETETTKFAIVGMHTFTGTCPDLTAFTDLVLGRTPVCPAPAKNRWRRIDHLPEDIQNLSAGFIDTLSMAMGECHIPPVQMPDILPQHLVLLKAAQSALTDAGISARPGENELPRTRAGCAVGIEFDFGATDFSLRWHAHSLPDGQQDQLAPPLTFTRTLGALGGIVASRLAREFKLGGPCFTVSAGAASGIKAIEVGTLSLAARETDWFICAGVDMAGDIRPFCLNHAMDPFASALPAEGAAALVIKRLADAQKDLDRIYAVIEGVSAGSGSPLTAENIPAADPFPAPDPFACLPDAAREADPAAAAFQAGLDRLLTGAGLRFADLSFVDTHCGGSGRLASVEARALALFNTRSQAPPCFLGWTAGSIGDTRGVSGLCSVIKTALCLHHRTIPGILTGPWLRPLENRGFVLPGASTPWPEEADTVERGVALAMTFEGGTAFCLLTRSSDARFAPVDISADQPKAAGSSTARMSQDLPPGISVGRPQAFVHPALPMIPTTRPPLSQELMAALNPGPSTAFENTAPGPIDSDLSVPPALPPKADPGNTWLPFPDPEPALAASRATARAHEKFLSFSQNSMDQLQTQFDALTRAAAAMVQNPLSDHAGGRDTDKSPDPRPAPDTTLPTDRAAAPETPRFTRDQCLEFAIGRAGKVLGPDFDIIDTYPVRVRLPGEPLMLVDRIMAIEGTPCSLGPGKIITQHDVLPGAWYLDGGSAPVSISIEAGQADLFLCAFLGIDHVVKGRRKYRLLDAKVTFHRPLPRPGETIEYHICIDRFLRQGDVYLFFFHYKGYIDRHLFISMRDGCAGFFTEQEVNNSGGIVLKKQDRTAAEPAVPFDPLVPARPAAFSDEQVAHLRQGNLAAAFGSDFTGMTLGAAQRLPGGHMHLIDRVLSFDPNGGKYGLGTIVAEADIRPDAWFLTCHFIDDPVMPGTLMYECCAHALRIFVQRMGWVSPDPAVHFDVLPDNESDLKCRGPVTPLTRKARYEIEIRQMGYMDGTGQPFVIADAHMFADDLRIVFYQNMGMTLTGVTRTTLEHAWRHP